jgi:NAD+ diphosphatase
MRDAEAVTFSGGRLDRAAHLRGDPARLAAMAAARESLWLPVWRGKPLFDTRDGLRLGWIPAGHEIFVSTPGEMIFLGLKGAAPLFARDLSGWPGPEGVAEGPGGFLDESRASHPALPGSLEFAELRAVMGAIGSDDAGVAAAAKGIFGWHDSHRFCAKCGTASEPADGGWKRVCPACGAQHFPRTDPVVIMLITSGDDVLLGRSAAWPPGMYSLLAGFMEPGESIEAAVRREVWEEAGVRVGAVDYLSSQPWPFPSSLMIGCRGKALTREITLDPVELEDGRWLGKQAVLEGLGGRNPDIKPARKGSIARFLLERWLADSLC